jgi:hypothetical protein
LRNGEWAKGRSGETAKRPFAVSPIRRFGTSMIRRAVYTLFALAGLALGGLAAPEIIRLSQNIPGDSKPIILYADEISTWLEGNQRVFLLKGMILVEHGLVQGRMQGAVGWVDQERTKRTGILHLDLFGEGDVRLEGGTEKRSGPTAFIDLNTRGELKLRAQFGKVIQSPRQDDPLYRRAAAERAALSAPPSTPAIKRGSSHEPGENSGILKTSDVSPAGSPTTVPTQKSPAGSAPDSAYVIPPSAPNKPGTIPDPGPPGLQPPVIPGTPSPGEASVVPAVPLPGPPANPVPRPPPRPGAGLGPVVPGPPRQFRIVPRYSQGWNTTPFIYPNGEQAILVTGGVILTILNPDPRVELLDIEADRLVLWTRGNLQDFSSEINSPESKASREVEFYLSGNVVIRERSAPRLPGQRPPPEPPILRADEVYYDLSRNVAVARPADLEFRQPGVPDPIHLRAEELVQVSPKLWRAIRSELSSSRLPSDPGLKIYVVEATLEERQVPKRGLFGRPVFNPLTGQEEIQTQLLFHGDNVFLEIENIPIFYLPFVQGDARDPLGPLEDVELSYNRVFGFRLGVTLNLLDLLGIEPKPGTRWRMDVDYLTRRGPAMGTEYDYSGKDLFGLPGHYEGFVKAWGILDEASDILGGGRGPLDHHPEGRGRFLWRQNWNFLEDFTLQFQGVALSDKNLFEQYYKNEFDNDINQETFLYFKQQHDNWAWTFLTEVRDRRWVNETDWLPRGDGYLIGQSFFDLLTYDAHLSAGYAQLKPTEQPPPPESLTTMSDNTGRFDIWQDLSLPFTLGPLRLVPYGVLDLAYYTRDLTGSDRGRLYEGGGIRASMPLSRLYPDIHSELWNLNGIYHKIVISTNYYIAHSDTSFLRLPQLDRINDDATDQALRDIKPLEPAFNPANGLFLATSPLFDPQLYAIRRLIDNRIDTLDTIEVLQADIRQRWQTKRGYPGMQHTVDWMTLDLSGSFFPHSGRDNFGDAFAFLQYDWNWNIGDRTALASTGWIDPEAHSPQVYTVGLYLDRPAPDRASFYLGFRSIQPVNSEALIAAITYVMSPKYALTGTSFYDFATKSQANSLMLIRTGKDLQMSIGISYNSLLNTFGFNFIILPNTAAALQRTQGVPTFASTLLAH